MNLGKPPLRYCQSFQSSLATTFDNVVIEVLQAISKNPFRLQASIIRDYTKIVLKTKVNKFPFFSFPQTVNFLNCLKVFGETNQTARQKHAQEIKTKRKTKSPIQNRKYRVSCKTLTQAVVVDILASFVPLRRYFLLLLTLSPVGGLASKAPPSAFLRLLRNRDCQDPTIF